MSSIHPPCSKPDPAVYTHGLARTGCVASECLAVEDSPNGVLSAVRAGIRTVGYVGNAPETERATVSRKLMDAGAFHVCTRWREAQALLCFR